MTISRVIRWNDDRIMAFDEVGIVMFLPVAEAKAELKKHSLSHAIFQVGDRKKDPGERLEHARADEVLR